MSLIMTHSTSGHCFDSDGRSGNRWRSREPRLASLLSRQTKLRLLSSSCLGNGSSPSAAFGADSRRYRLSPPLVQRRLRKNSLASHDRRADNY